MGSHQLFLIVGSIDIQFFSCCVFIHCRCIFSYGGDTIRSTAGAYRVGAQLQGHACSDLPLLLAQPPPRRP